MNKLYLINGHNVLNKSIRFDNSIKGDVYSSRHVLPLRAAAEIARAQGTKLPTTLTELDSHSVPVTNYSIDYNFDKLINSNRSDLMRDLKRITPIIDSYSSKPESSIFVLNRAHFDGLHYFMFNEVPHGLIFGNDVILNHIALDSQEDGGLVASSDGVDSVQFNSLTDKIISEYKNLRWKKAKF